MGNQIIGEYELKKDGDWYLISRVPLSWLKEAKLPVVIDPNTTIKAVTMQLELQGLIVESRILIFMRLAITPKRQVELTTQYS